MTIDELKAEMEKGARAILMVRHAERPQIDPDDPTFGDALALTERGARTATELGRCLADFHGDVQFAASPLMRTRMTAERIAAGMGVAAPEILAEGRLGNDSFYYTDTDEVLEVFKPENFFNACIEYFATGRQRGFAPLGEATDAFEAWLDERFAKKLFVAVTHDLYIAAFLTARGAAAVPFTRENWVRFLDAGAILVYPDGTRRYEFVRTGLSDGICGVRRLSAVVFDFGGVMTTSTMPERVRARTDQLGIDWKVLEDGFARYRRLMDSDFMSMDEMYDLIWADAGLELSADVRAKIVAEDMASFLEGSRNLATLEWMRGLKAHGLKIGILSNMSTNMAARFREVFADYIALADAMVISGEERMFKPQRRIYELLRSRLGLPAGELCFIDDTEANCTGARRAGWSAIRFSSAEQAARDFAALAGM
ncbi:MAG: HAD-IA family hydrolase [Kiritimatiellae bacterium]|nr:HAD-IA family hydrolase [Kiritimatiellia bacterium]